MVENWAPASEGVPTIAGGVERGGCSGKAQGWRDNPPMARYVFFPGNRPSAKSLTAAKRAVSDQGASVVGTAEGGMLVETTPARARRVAQALPGWEYAPERVVTQVPERRPRLPTV